MTSNFEKFLEKFPFEESVDLLAHYNLDARQFCDFLMRFYPNKSFGDGQITILSSEMNKELNHFVGQWCPEDLDCLWFARTWKGNVLGLEFDAEGLLVDVLLVDLGGNGLLIVADDLEGFFAEVTFEPDDNNPLLEPDKFRYWSRKIGGKLDPSKCIGFHVPLFLGGMEEVENQEIIDWDVYWHLTSQIMIKNGITS